MVVTREHNINNREIMLFIGQPKEKSRMISNTYEDGEKCVRIWNRRELRILFRYTYARIRIINK